MFASLKAGGLLMIPIIVCGIIATFIIIERCIYFYKVRKNDKVMMENIPDFLRTGNYDAVMTECLQTKTPLALVIKKAIECRHYQKNDLKDAVEAEMDFVIPRYEHMLTALGTIASISTLLGLLGTVTGNIKAFGVLGSGGTMGDPSLLAGAIAEALVTTVAGLCVSIPSLIFHNYFLRQVDHLIVEMESYVTKVILMITERHS